MSKTYRRTQKGRKVDWLPEIRSYHLDRNFSNNTRWGLSKYDLRCPKKKEWLQNNPHRRKDVDDYFMMDYGKSPSHWNRQYSTIPRRANDRQLIDKIKKGEIDPDDTVFLDNKKPVVYYW